MNSTSEICRMSWFLIAPDEGFIKAPQGKPLYCIVHSVDLIDTDSNNMYVNRLVRFNLNQCLVQGKVLLASDDRTVVERRKKQLMEEADETMQLPTERHFLIQYSKSAHNFIHAIVQQKDICSPSGDLTNQRKVLVHDGKIQRLATVLYSHESEERVLQELQNLKRLCFEQGFDENDVETVIAGEPWLLVQYSCKPTNVVYAIVNYRQTVWQEENLYRDVVAYLSDGSSIFQSIIVRKSWHRSEVETALQQLKHQCLIVQFPPDEGEELSNGEAVDNDMALDDHDTMCAKSLQLDQAEIRKIIL